MAKAAASSILHPPSSILHPPSSILHLLFSSDLGALGASALSAPRRLGPSISASSASHGPSDNRPSMDVSIYRLRQRDILALCVMSLLLLGIVMVQSASMNVTGKLGWGWTDFGLRHAMFAG